MRSIAEPERTHSDEGLVEAVEAQVPDEPAGDERRNEPKVEVRHHEEGRAAHHPRKKKNEKDGRREENFLALCQK